MSMKHFFTMVIISLVTLCLWAPAFAAEGETPSGIAGEVTTSQTTTTEKTEANKTDGSNFLDVQSPEELLDLKEVTVDDIGNKLDEKGMDIIRLMQKVCQYICIAAFIIGAIMFVIGLIANKKTMVSGILTLAFAGIAYAAITCGPTIVKLIASWAAS